MLKIDLKKIFRKKPKPKAISYEVVIPKTSIIIYAKSENEALVKASDAMKFLILNYWDDLKKKAENNEIVKAEVIPNAT